MIDENLPTFFLKTNPKTPQQNTIYHSHHGNDPEPAYTLRSLDPTAPSSQNRYGVALYDPYVPDIVFGEVAVVPAWTQPSLSAENIRANGGNVPPPEPILPTEFTINLYNPDQEIVVRHQSKTWNKPAQWMFEMPQRTFRVPSSSRLDRTQIDPSISDVTPKLRFSWRKDGKLSKDMSCLLHGKSSSIPETKSKSREPDITVALFQGLRELTLYEPNLYRVEMEDFKGLEVVLLLAAVAIRDIFFGPAKEAFHIVPGGPALINGRPQTAPPGRKSPANQTSKSSPHSKHPPTGLTIQTDPTSLHDPGRQTQLAQEEARRTEELLASEKRAQEQARRQQQEDIDKETKRLQEIYGQEEQKARLQNPSDPGSPARPNLPPRQSGPPHPYPHQYSQSLAHLPPQPTPQPPWQSRPQHPQRVPVPAQSHSPYLTSPGGLDPRAQSTSHIMPSHPTHSHPPPIRRQSMAGFNQQITSSGALQVSPQPTQQQQQQPQLQPKKSSFFGFSRNKEEPPRNRLDKKRSSMFFS
ncbi:hypothetical protein N7495_004351 [Penicillium taxi]|uniref:uncharacterized protein n=1 Tax=Penicillium taxi TaxID=168475 RepID=UPI002544DD03|nr:uncharacterized protein N7495_004351 [Penicillium taxi]KAJ5899607.1 hypothetical protein N7495_004351 [Penicillium taxi]